MNRKIKFRVWDIKHKTMVSPIKTSKDIGYVDFDIKTDGKITREILGRDLMSLDRTTTESQENYIIQQFTGLQDIKGKDIYESDIIQVNHKIQLKEYDKNDYFKKGVFTLGEICNNGFIGKVVFDKNNDFDDFYCNAVLGWCLESRSDYRQSLCHILEKYNNHLYDDIYYKTLENKYEIIGNIFENPELLEK